MNISLDPRANYKTQSNAYDQLLVGKPLSNRKITQYAREGRYGPEIQARILQKKRAAVRRSPKQTLDQLLSTL